MVRSHCITALGVGAARRILADLFAFIDISAMPSDLQSESLRADTEAVTRARENALLVLGAWVCGRAVSTDHDAVLSLLNKGMLAAADSLLVTVPDADGVSRTLTVFLTIDLLRVARGVRVTDVASWALAQIAALQVHAESAQATRGAGFELGAFVDIPAPSNRSVIREASPTHALATSIHRYTLLVWRAWTGS